MAEPSETLAAAELSQEAADLFAPDLTHGGFVEKLSAAALLPDAVTYMAHSLRPRECVKWSLSCLRALKTKTNEPGTDAMASVDRWLADSTDANRRACRSAAEKAGLKNAAGCLAMAVFFSEGSIAPPERDKVPVPSGVAQKMSAGAIILAVVEDPKQADTRYRQCLALASRTV